MQKNVTNCDQAIQRHLCDFWVHIKCNDLNYTDYKFLQNSNDPWFCISYCSETFPFNTVKSNKNFTSIFHDSNNKSKTPDDKDNSLLLKPSEHLKYLTNQFNNMSSPPDGTNSGDPENTVSSKYYDIEELQKLKITNKSRSLSLFHINTCSLSKNFYDLQHLLSCTNKSFDVIAINETRITKNVSIINNLSINNYSIEFTPTESSAGGTLLHIANHLSYILRQDLNIYKKNELESTLIEIMNPKKSNTIVGTMYKHPSMDITDFNSNYLNYNVHNPTNEFLDSLASNSFLPYILQPTRITSHSKTLIDNIFTNVILPDSLSGNLTATISDHLPQFLMVPNIFSNPPSNKSNIYERDWSNFDQ